MSYATQQDLVDRFGSQELQQVAPDGAGGIDSSQIDQALADADATIDGYLTARYSLPLSTTPALLKRIAADLARFQLHDQLAPETVTKRYDDAIQILSRISSGQISLGAQESTEREDATIDIQSQGSTRWGREQSKGYV